MNRSQLTSLVVALACVGTVGVSATTLSSSVAADPSDALDPDYEVLPVAGDGLEQLESAVASDGDESTTTQRDGPGDQSDSAGSREERTEVNDAGDDASEDSSVGGGDADGGTGGGDADAGGTGADHGGSSGGDGLNPSPGEDRFTLIDLLTLLVVLSLLVAAAWLCYRYRDRFRGLFAGPEESADDDPRPMPDGPPADDNLVFETWDALLSDLDVEAETLTTGECAAAATAAGFDREEIERLRLDFEDVRYGGQPVTDDRRRRARNVQKRLGLNGESP
jgi:hypothetical protein